ncbi:hypothetical protein ACFO4N_00220 [Camelliibacillus cellulosilyticus]|uniref:Uncharacterized protein n=1 Tax=Camelliibacillus cellulosilyticus TaxID=2174486 RepID=A0ABV9GIU1_9BACL
MGKQVLNWIGRLCMLFLVVFSLVILIKNIGQWTSIDYIWFGAIILFFIAVIGERVGAKKQGQEREHQ